jgi:cell division septation protein DedD
MQEGRDDPPVRELRFEGVGLFIVGGLFLAALAGSFYLGRWVERRGAIPGSGSGIVGREAAETKSEPAVDVGKETNYFDTVGGGEKQAEPQREARRREPRPVPSEPSQVAAPAAPQAPPSSAQAEDSGPFYVQLFAGRDRASADNLVRSLKVAGYRVRVDTEGTGEGSLYKVRVGGYSARGDAQVLAERLKNEGYSGAWVIQVD